MKAVIKLLSLEDFYPQIIEYQLNTVYKNKYQTIVIANIVLSLHLSQI